MKKRLTLKRELIRLVLISSVCTLIFACIAVFNMFFSFFFQETQEDIEYVLESTTQQYQSYMRFIENGEISIRRNRMLDDFFKNNEYDESVAISQLSYSMNIYSESNLVERQIPFITSIYLFNNEGKYIYKRYYATTLAVELEEENRFKMMQKWFKTEESLYTCTTDEESLYFFFHVYDDDMKEKGICIVEVGRESIEKIFEEITAYKNSLWVIFAGNNKRLAFGGEVESIRQIEEAGYVWNNIKTIGGKKVIGCADTGGCGTGLIIAVGQENVFSILQPTFRILFIGLLIVSIITFLISYGTSYSLLKPVTEMLVTIHAFGEQNFEARIKDSEIQEFQDIGNVFNEMADKLKYLITDVYEKQLLATQAQVKYLQAQINPHFQFNILSMLSLKAKMANNEEVYEGLRAFSKLTQGKIFREKEIKIKVREEIEIVSFYLYLQKSRYQEKLSYEIDLEKEEINEYFIPRLLIEPLVENAVSHGLEPKRSNGRVKVRLYDRNEKLHIEVEDNGVGIDYEMMQVKENEESETIKHTHTSLENTKRLLQILYGENYKITFCSEKNVGTKAEIVIPIERG